MVNPRLCRGDSNRFDRCVGRETLQFRPRNEGKPMRDFKSLTHTRWDCKYHVVFIPKRRRKLIYGHLRKGLGEIFHELASRRECKIEEGHLMSDHVHMCISIPPKYSVSNLVGYLKGKSAIVIARRYKGKQRNFTGEHFWARGYYVSTVGLDEEMVREYIRNQEQEDERRDQLALGLSAPWAQ